MSTPQQTPDLSPLEQLGQNVAAQQNPQPQSDLSPLEVLGQTVQQQHAAPPNLSPEEEQSRTRQMLVSGLTGMPSGVMTPQEQTQFQQGKAAGAISVPLVAGATAGAAAFPGLAEPVLQHLEDQAAEWASKYPTLIKLLAHVGVPTTSAGIIGYLIHKAK